MNVNETRDKPVVILQSEMYKLTEKPAAHLDVWQGLTTCGCAKWKRDLKNRCERKKTQDKMEVTWSEMGVQHGGETSALLRFIQPEFSF